MALVFSGEDTSTFKVQPMGSSKFMSIKGVNGNEQDATVICNGIASLLAIAGLTGDYENASRVVTEDVWDDGT